MTGALAQPNDLSRFGRPSSLIGAHQALLNNKRQNPKASTGQPPETEDSFVSSKEEEQSTNKAPGFGSSPLKDKPRISPPKTPEAKASEPKPEAEPQKPEKSVSNSKPPEEKKPEKPINKASGPKSSGEGNGGGSVASKSSSSSSSSKSTSGGGSGVGNAALPTLQNKADNARRRFLG